MSIEKLLKIKDVWFNCMLVSAVCGGVALVVTIIMMNINSNHLYTGGSVTIVMYSFSRFAHIKKENINQSINNTLALYSAATVKILAGEI